MRECSGGGSLKCIEGGGGFGNSEVEVEGVLIKFSLLAFLVFIIPFSH